MSYFTKMIEEDDKRYEKLRDDYGSSTYTGEKCINCNRNRVEVCNNGKFICEKCHFDQKENDYCFEHMSLFE